MVFAADAEAFAPAVAAVTEPSTRRLFVRGAARYEEDFGSALDTPASARAEVAFKAIRPDSVAKYLFTSGSTGSPKAVINTHRMICANQAQVREMHGFLKEAPPTLLDWLPWNHTAGGNKLFFMALFNGGTLYIDDGNPTPAGMLRTVRNLKDVSPDWYFNVPKGYEALLPHIERDTELARNFFSKLKMLWYSSAGLAQHTWDALQRVAVETVGERIMIGAGLGATETAPTALVCTWPQPYANNIGLPCPEMILKLVPMDGKLDARVKGPNITPGYLHAPEQSRAAFDEEGYYRFGDALRPANPDDIGAGFLFDGRTAENFKLDTGTWVAASALRTRFIDHFGACVRDVAIAGPNRSFLTALVFPDFDALREIAQAEAGVNLETLLVDPGVVSHLGKKLAALAAESTGSSNLIKRLMLVAGSPSPDAGEVTEKGSLNQRAVLANRADLVEELYRGSSRVIGLARD